MKPEFFCFVLNGHGGGSVLMSCDSLFQSQDDGIPFFNKTFWLCPEWSEMLSHESNIKERIKVSYLSYISMGFLNNRGTVHVNMSTWGKLNAECDSFITNVQDHVSLKLW